MPNGGSRRGAPGRRESCLRLQGHEVFKLLNGHATGAGLSETCPGNATAAVPIGCCRHLPEQAGSFLTLGEMRKTERTRAKDQHHTNCSLANTPSDKS